MEVVFLNPRVLQAVDYWQLQKSYESLMVILSDKKDVFYKVVDIMLPLILTCITLILQFFAFNVIFKEDKNEERI